MTVDTLRAALGWCSIINIGMLLWWSLFFIFARDWIYKIHSRWFKLTPEKFDAIHYSGMAFYKICIFIFNVVPYFALLIAGK
ncbi:MAG: hypothetical protein JW728_00610 [Candidatus Aureabacteria bacterium]|nr:hypothetical protein [Candidatus Auribacterota bacterium]